MWIATTETGGLMIASNPDFDAILVADSEAEVHELIEKHNPKVIENREAGKAIPKPTTLHSLSADWRWIIYRDKARFLCGGAGWAPLTIGEYPGVQARIAPDPVSMCYFATNNGEMVKHQGAVVIESSPMDLMEALMDIGMEMKVDNELGVAPLFSFMDTSPEVWFRGRTHNVSDTLKRNYPLLKRFVLGEGMEEGETKE